mgnify:FL=1
MEILEKTLHVLTDAKDAVCDYFSEDTMISRKKLLTLGAICTLTGIVTGFLFSPIKKGIYINISNNCNETSLEKEEENQIGKKKKGRR